MSKSKEARTEKRDPASAFEDGVMVGFPIGELPEAGYISTHVDLQLDHRQAIALRRVRAGFEDHPMKLANGKFVQSGADVVRWWLDQVATAVK